MSILFYNISTIIMKQVAILTLRPYINFGCILQAYALKTALEKHDFEVLFINRCANLKWYQKAISPLYYGYKSYKTKETHQFVETHLYDNVLTVKSNMKLNTVNKLGIYACIVGSDQVWRRDYTGKFGYNYFLDFVTNKKIKKISYAASFGLDYCEYNKQEIDNIKVNLSSFDMITVREESGLSILSESFNINNAHWVLDPTFLLTKDDYLSLINTDNVQKHDNYIFSYLLCDKNKTDIFLNNIANKTSKSLVNCYLKYMYEQYKDIISVEQWLTNIANADFVITDSFHGCVFSIIFNKQFAVILNQGGGSTRIASLMNLLSLSNRIVEGEVDIEKLFVHPIDYDIVNEKVEKERSRSLELLLKSLD